LDQKALTSTYHCRTSEVMSRVKPSPDHSMFFR
jgi:hypothetical protein